MDGRNDEAQGVDQRMSPGAPWYRVAFQWGLPSAVAFFLLFQSAGWIPSVADELKGAMGVHNVASVKIAAELAAADAARSELLRAVVARNEELVRVMRVMCSNAAKDALERSQCLGLKSVDTR